MSKIDKMQDFIVVAECAIEHNGCFLIIKRPAGVHAEGLLSFPGGKFELEDGDSNSDAVKQTVKREVFEEVGLKLIDPIEYVTSSYFIDVKTGKHVIDFIYHCRLAKTIASIKSSASEVPEYYWLKPEDIISRVNCPLWLAKYLRTLTGSV